MTFHILRTFRTSSSERCMVQSTDTNHDIAVVDLHYLSDESVKGTLIILDDAFSSEDKTEELLEFIDHTLLPSVSLDDKNLEFMVVQGTLLGQFASETSES